MMADQTPAWREVYTRIMDEMAARYPTYWGAIDWLTQIGDDPSWGSYPPEVQALIPENLRGKYNRVGSTANGIDPYGFQPDPLGAEGNLFFRGWLNLILSVYKYVSGDDKWEKPFQVTGYRDRQFEWTQQRIVERLEQQWSTRPQGIHCENTKIWPYCLSAAGLGLLLYDKLHGTRSHRVYENWLEYARGNYMGFNDGKLQTFTSYYDPTVNFKLSGPPLAGVAVGVFILPQNREIATLIYEAAASQHHWSEGPPVTGLGPHGLIMARELGDRRAVERLSAAAEVEYEPKFFGEDRSRFGWWFKLGERYPRGQRSAIMMVSDVGAPGDWVKAFQVPHLDKYTAPTVHGVAFPQLGVSRAWNDTSEGVLHVTTYAATPERRGTATTWRVTNVPDAKLVRMTCDGQPFQRFHMEGRDRIRVEATIDTHHYRVFTGYHGVRGPRDAASNERHDSPVAHTPATKRDPNSAVSAALTVVNAAGMVTCPCCSKG